MKMLMNNFVDATKRNVHAIMIGFRESNGRKIDISAVMATKASQSNMTDKFTEFMESHECDKQNGSPSSVLIHLANTQAGM